RFQPARRGFLHRSMCSLCLTTHPRGGVSLMTARKAGAAGREGNSVGAYMCTDLACSLYLRGLKVPEPGGRFEESLTLEQQIARTRGRLFAFLDALRACAGRPGSGPRPAAVTGGNVRAGWVRGTVRGCERYVSWRRPPCSSSSGAGTRWPCRRCARRPPRPSPTSSPYG